MVLRVLSLGLVLKHHRYIDSPVLSLPVIFIIALKASLLPLSLQSTLFFLVSRIEFTHKPLQTTSNHHKSPPEFGTIDTVWSAVSSGVPQGSIIGPLLFIVYINDLDEKMTSTVLKFADDTKISNNSQQELQRDLDTAVEWAQTWQMQFNTSKCKVMHVGHWNERVICNMGNHRLEEVEEEKDLGVLIHRTLSVSNNCAVAVKKANQMPGHIYRTVTHKSIQTVVPLYKALVRPHLEYCSRVWSPYLKKDILSIEKVQRRVTKMIPSISALTYEERLKRTGLISLENRRLRADLLEVFKGPFKCYVMQMGVGGCLIFWKKALRRCNVQCY